MGDLVEIRVSQLAEKTIPLKELKKWNIFSTIDDNFLQNIRIAHVHGTFGFLITTDDVVYAIGSGPIGSLGIGKSESVPSPVKIDTLCGQFVREFFTNAKASCFALTKDGRVFAWGSNLLGELGIETVGIITTPKLVKVGDGAKISQLSVGFAHTLALTMDTAEVFVWGYNHYGQLGLRDETNRSKPRNATSNITSNKIKQICSSQFSSFALTQSGDLYSWGHNATGELGIGNFIHSNIPTKAIFDTPIKKVINGPYHTVVLTKSGEVYACGSNSEGQLGIGDKTNLNVLTRVATDVEIIFDDISSMSKINQSLAKSKDTTFAWGEIHKGISFNNPTELNSLNFPHPMTLVKKEAQFMYKSLCASNYEEKGKSVLQTLETAIGGPGTDVEFKVEGSIIKAHKSILILRSDCIARKFSESWNKQDGQIELQDVKRDTFYALLYFLYTDKLYCRDVDFDTLSDLMKLADQYRETDLRKKCESVLQKQIKLENVFTIYKVAGECNAKVELNTITFVDYISSGDLLDKANLSGQEFLRFTKAWAEKSKNSGDPN
ncbi:RCC1 and BTB domain-containing protein 1 [Folsomia candida]|uniref:RCC1 and BTB domain-containing protein 1 n=2 Tax=Folsomia candida TaxID=158441 RepID=A0A226DW75_FOLCA|nr:RCC1 and BTB domain-containing protein 1 [Folsomia candida]